MAKIIKTKIINSVKQGYYRKNLLTVLFVALGLLCVTLTFFTYGISLVGAILFLYLAFRCRRGRGILKSGFEGEAKTTAVLKKLPKGYFIFPDIEIKAGRCTNQIDHIVVGKSGVFAVETKNHKGTIKGNDNDVYATQKKVTDARNKYKSTLYNPARQVKTHANTLQWLLSHNGVKGVDVEPIVYFSNIGAKVKLKSEQVAIFSARKNGAIKMRRYIKTAQPQRKLSQADCKEIVDLIISSSKNRQ